MHRIIMNHRYFRAVVGLALLGAVGCSSGESPAPVPVEGTNPADVPKGADLGLANPTPDTPKPGSRTSR